MELIESKREQLKIPLAYKDIVFSTLHNFLLWGGRVGGKTYNTAQMTIADFLNNPNTDVIVARVSYGSLADSSYAEFIHTIETFGNDIYDLFEFRKSPLRIEKKDGTGTIYFIGYGGSNTSRTKSIRPRHPIQTIILEETQELKDRRNLEEALASFRRHLTPAHKIYIMGNPQPAEAHWFSRFIKEKQQDSDWLVKNVTYLDIIPFINDYDLKEILEMKISDPERYKWFYLGLPSAGSTGVYPMFRTHLHCIDTKQFNYIWEHSGLKCVGVVISGDGAVTHDSTAFVCMLIMNNGQAIIPPSGIFYHNPQQDGVIGYHQLVQDHLTRWIDLLCKRYYLGTADEIRQHAPIKPIPMFMRIDSASPDLIQECRFFLGDRINVSKINKKSVMEMTGVCQSAIANNNICIVEEKCYYSWVKNLTIKNEMNILAEQISLLVWNEKQTGYDPIVPNDVCDAFTYGTYFWYSNQENLQYFNYLKAISVKNKLICDILKEAKGE